MNEEILEPTGCTGADDSPQLKSPKFFVFMAENISYLKFALSRWLS